MAEAVNGPGPQGLKPGSFLALGGTAEAVPFPRPKQPRVVQQSETGQAPSLHEFFHKASFSAACEVAPFPRPFRRLLLVNSFAEFPLPTASR